MRNRNRRLNKKGFTLVELCVVMAVIAIVAGMIITFLIMFENRSKMLDVEYNKVTDIGAVQQLIDEWIGNYDSLSYNISAFGNGNNMLVAKNVTITYDADEYEGTFTIGGIASQLYYDDGKLVWKVNGKEKKSVEVKNITKVEFYIMQSGSISSTSDYVKSKSNTLVKAIAGIKDESPQIMLYPIFSNIVRARYLSEERSK